MTTSLCDKVIHALRQAHRYNSQVMVRPEVILWPDEDRQWSEVIGMLQEELPQLMVLGSYDPLRKSGPAIWLKCMMSRTIPEANWPEDLTPIIYLPGVAKADLRDVEDANIDLQPLLEYQYTGTLFMQDNGREWSILAFVENADYGLGVRIAHDQATKDALKKTLPNIFRDVDVFYNKSLIDAPYLNQQIFPNLIPSVLKWMCQGDHFLQALDEGLQEVFANLCQSQFEIDLDYRNIQNIAEKLGCRKNSWKQVWQMYSVAPRKYPELENLLRLAKPVDMGAGIFLVPSDSWPQVNEEQEEALALALGKLPRMEPAKALAQLNELELKHAERRGWVWHELGKAPLAEALQFIRDMADRAMEYYPWSSLDELQGYYTSSGFIVDHLMRKALASVRSERDKGLVKGVCKLFYEPWLATLTQRFQNMVAIDSHIFSSQVSFEETESFVLFIDAFRYELAMELMGRLQQQNRKVSIKTDWSAIPSVTPTAKLHASPISPAVSEESTMIEFRPQLKDGRDVHTHTFRTELESRGFLFVAQSTDIQFGQRHWQEIGDIDTKGHNEQSDVVKRIGELFDLIEETIDAAFDRGVTRIKIVTDHGWLLMPGGLPKVAVHAGLTDIRWGRCAVLKEGVTSDLLHLPWRWNPGVYVAYAPGISFFKSNVEYAHGGISLHECLVPVLIVENDKRASVLVEIKVVRWVNLKCSVTTNDVPDGFKIDIRTKFSDPTTSIVLSTDCSLRINSASVMVDDDYDQKAATIVLLDENGRILDKKPTTVGIN